MIYIRLGEILSLSHFLGDLHSVKEFCHLALSVIYIFLGGILSLIPFLFLFSFFFFYNSRLAYSTLECWLNSTFIALFQMWIQSSVTFINGTSSNAQCSMVVAVSSRPSSPGDSYLVLSIG